jgi:hypothetical protein
VRILADLVLLMHAAFVAFVVFGQLLILASWWRGWRWARNVWFRLTHLVAIGLVVLEAWFGVPCPLTVLEDNLRRAGGGTGYATSFIGHWLQYLIFYEAPAAAFLWVYTVFLLVVVICLIGYPPQRR